MIIKKSRLHCVINLILDWLQQVNNQPNVKKINLFVTQLLKASTISLIGLLCFFFQVGSTTWRKYFLLLNGIDADGHYRTMQNRKKTELR